MSTETADVAVVVVTFNSSDVLPGLLTSLPAGLGDLTWSLCVVDSASHDRSTTIARRLVPSCTVVEMGRNAGYAAGLNAGVSASPPHRAVLVLNPDVRLDAGSVGNLAERLAQPGVGIAVPRLRDGNGDLHHSIRREPTTLRALGDAVLGAGRAGRWPACGELVTSRASYAHGGPVDWAEGSVQLISADCWRACGPWDESFFLYSEETEFGLRARDRGFVTWFEPSSSAVHLQGDSRTSPTLWALLVVNRVRLQGLRHGWLAATPFWVVTLAREVSRAALGRATSRAAVGALLRPRRWGTFGRPEQDVVG